MKKTLILAMVGVLLISGSAFAAGRQLVAQPNATFNPGVGAASGPATTNNDDSCDISVAPAATLLLPYFEVDLTATAGTGRTTLFSITNVSPYAQIAHVTLWTDWSFPVLDFNIFLTGYDVQSINLFDVIQRGLIGGTTTGTSTSSPNATAAAGNNNRFTPNAAGATGSNPNIGTQPFLVSAANSFGNPNFLGTVAANCALGRLPGQLPGPLATDVRALLTVGRSTGAGISCAVGGAQAQVGANHGANLAIGYATIDVAATCSLALPTDLTYFTGEILFDNVLIGEYFDISQSTTTGNFAGGNPLVHIRAVPEGGAAGSLPALITNLPYTFYDRYTVGAVDRRIDRRQPLPSAFAARWISGSGAAFDTQFKIWREGFTGNTTSTTSCAAYALNGDMGVGEFVRFDERENAGILGLGGIIVSPPPPGAPGFPETGRFPITDSKFPTVASTDVAGWMYMNVNNGGAASRPAGLQTVTYSASRAGFGAVALTRDVSQNWVTVAMFAESRFGTDFDAAWMGNGCSTALPLSSTGVAQLPTGRIAPAGGVLVCPPLLSPTGGVTFGVGANPPTALSGGTINCVGTNVTP